MTKAGRIFLSHARDILDRSDRAARAAYRAARHETNKVTLGTVGAASVGRLPDILRTLRRAHEAVQVTPHEMTPDDQLKGLLEDRIDVGISYMPIRHESLEVAPLPREPFVVAMPSGHALARKKTKIEPAAIAAEPLVCCPEKQIGKLHRRTMEACRELGIAPKDIREAPQLLSFVAMIAAGIGVGFVPASVAKLKHKGVVFRELATAAPTVEFALVWRRDEESPAVRAFCEVAQATGRERTAKAG